MPSSCAVFVATPASFPITEKGENAPEVTLGRVS